MKHKLDFQIFFYGKPFSQYMLIYSPHEFLITLYRLKAVQQKLYL